MNRTALLLLSYSQFAWLQAIYWILLLILFLAFLGVACIKRNFNHGRRKKKWIHSSLTTASIDVTDTDMLPKHIYWVCVWQKLPYWFYKHASICIIMQNTHTIHILTVTITFNVACWCLSSTSKNCPAKRGKKYKNVLTYSLYS